MERLIHSKHAHADAMARPESERRHWDLPKRISLIGLLIFSLQSVATLAQAPLPKVRVFATGGTISGYSASRDDQYGYRSGSIPPKQLLADIPEVNKVADVSWDEIAEVGSPGINTQILLKLAKAVNAWLAQPDSAGAVVTHGTATMEETPPPEAATALRRCWQPA